jgi:hypothetical protein
MRNARRCEPTKCAMCLARDSLHSVPGTWFTQLAFGESPDAVEKVLTMSPE